MGDPGSIVARLKPVFGVVAKRLVIKTDRPDLYTLASGVASPFPQHKGRPLEFACIRVGKAYVSLHLLPVYMNPALGEGISPELKKRMQGKACFNFKDDPEPALVAELKRIAEAGLKQWAEKKWA